MSSVSRATLYSLALAALFVSVAANAQAPIAMATDDLKDVKASIIAQIEPHWSIDVGAKNARDLKITIHVVLKPDGTVESAQIVPDPKFASNLSYEGAAQAARRAVLEASPIKLPPG